MWLRTPQALAFAAEHRLPVVKIHHMEAHAMVTRLPREGATIPEFPYAGRGGGVVHAQTQMSKVMKISSSETARNLITQY